MASKDESKSETKVDSAAETKIEAKLSTADHVAELKKNALDEHGMPAVNEHGQLIGLDGVNPVSNTNPDPRMVRDTRFL